VLAVVSFRVIKGESSDPEYHLVCDHHPEFIYEHRPDDVYIVHPDDTVFVHESSEEMFVPPPVYVYKSAEGEAVATGGKS